MIMIQANANHLHYIHTTSAQRLRRWSNLVQMLYKCFAFTGMARLRMARYKKKTLCVYR